MKEKENKLSIVESLSTFKESEFVAEGLLGTGIVGRVSLGTFGSGGDKVAVKYVSDAVSKEDFIREVNLLEKAKHPNVIPILGVMESKLAGFPYALVTQYMDGGSLYNLLQNGVSLPWEQRLNIAINIALGLMHMHSLKILHGDLKSLNILVNSQSEAKIADFGSAIEVRDAKNIIATNIGTKLWQAPELYYGLPIITEKSDIYSFGVILGELVTGKIPENSNNISEIVSKKQQGCDNQNFYEPTEIKGEKIADNADKIIGRTLWDLSQACQSLKPEDRPDLQSIIHLLKATCTYAKEYVSGVDEIQNSAPLFRDSSTDIPAPVTEEKNTNADNNVFLESEIVYAQRSSLLTCPSTLTPPPKLQSDNFSFGKCFAAFFKSCRENTRELPAQLHSDETRAALLVLVDLLEQTRCMM